MPITYDLNPFTMHESAKVLRNSEQNLKGAQEKQKSRYNKKAWETTFCPEEEVLMLRPIKRNAVGMVRTCRFVVVALEG